MENLVRLLGQIFNQNYGYNSIHADHQIIWEQSHCRNLSPKLMFI